MEIKNDESLSDSVGNFFDKLKSYIEFEEKWDDGMAKVLTKFFGSILFLNITFVFIIFWVVINSGIVPGLQPFDVYPFHWLIIVVELFTLILSVIVLINQNREAKINEVRQQMDFEINVRAEHEITKILHMLEEVQVKLGIAKKDQELEAMKERIDIAEIKEDIEQILEETSNTNGIH